VRHRPALFAAAVLHIAGCGADSPEDMAALQLSGSTDSIRRDIRPTDGSGWHDNGYGIPAEVYDSRGGHFRIFYVTTGENAVNLKDVAPKNGVPDFVEQVGAAAEETYTSTVKSRGFRAPLDDSLYHDRPDYGGDGRYDIYLRWAGRGSDGYRVTEVCTDGSDAGTSGRCAGYFVMNPSFQGTRYPSELDAIQVLTSHELFHSVQDAYSAEQWRTFGEGTAVWNELQVFPSSAGAWRDYLGFLPALFNEPERPFDKSMGAGPAAAYAYGTAAWAEYLSERFGAPLLREIWEGCEQSPGGEVRHFLDVIEALLPEKYGSSLAAAWTEFTRWNLLTGKRASPDRGYLRAAEYPEARLEPILTALDQTATVELNGLASRYLRLQPELAAATSLRLSVRDPATDRPVAAAAVVSASGGAPGPFVELAAPAELTLQPGESVLVVLTGALRGARSRLVQVRMEVVTPSLPPQSEEPGGCAIAARATHGPKPSALFAGLFALLGMVRRRRVDDERS